MKTAEEIVKLAVEQYNPVAVYACFSGGDDSLALTHWMMTNIPNCRVFHANTGIGVEETRQFVRDTCTKYGWPLDEIRAKEDCGQDYDALVLEYGFPGPAHHFKMYCRLKERCIDMLLRRVKTNRSQRVLLATGIRRDESKRRMGYKDREINKHRAKIWVNPIFWWNKTACMQYIADNKLVRNPVSETLGMSGECLCGAYAHKGELALVSIVSPATAERIRDLQVRAREAGFCWGWEDKPPKYGVDKTRGKFMPFCVGCEKHD